MSEKETTMKEFSSIDIRPYQMLCLICRQGRQDISTPYYHEEWLNQIQAELSANPAVPVTLRCNTETVFSYQNPGRDYDTSEGEMYNDLRDLTILQRIGLVPGATLPAIDIFSRLGEAFPTCQGVCWYAEDKAPGWPQCRFARSGNYERGMGKGLGAIIPQRTPEEKQKVKKESAASCCDAKRLRIRPHHLLCMSCFHGGRPNDEIVPIQEDNLWECIHVMQKNFGVPVELIHGPCMVCPPCSAYYAPANLCIGGQCMGMRDDKKDLDTLRRLGLRFGDVLPARELLQRLFTAIESTSEICGNGDGVVRSREWSVCGGPTGNDSFKRARQAGLGVPGVVVPADPATG